MGMAQFSVNAQRFDHSSHIAVAIDEFEHGLHTLAGLGGGQITEDHRDGSGACPVCDTAITHYPKDKMVLCRQCVELFMPAKKKLCGFSAFNTDAI